MMNPTRDVHGRAPLALVVLSGGQDSTTCLALAIQNYGRRNVFTITFDYGQRHRVEVQAAERVADVAGLNLLAQFELIFVNPNILRGTSPLLKSSGETVERYENAEVLPGGLEKTFVPMRNQLFLTIAFNRAVLLGLRNECAVDIFTGVSQEDYGGYPDCRLTFVNMLQKAAQLSLDDPSLPNIEIKTPLMFLSKAETVTLSETIANAREMLAYSHTCYNGMIPPCGHCHACLLRARGYSIAGKKDPLLERLGADAKGRGE